jgi:prepilin-type processing-associated H-X9-DG protein
MNGNNAVRVPIPPIETYVCPSDRDVTTQPDLAGLSYNANSGAWDLDSSGNFVYINSSAKKGDTADNGIFFDLAQYDRGGAKGPRVRMSSINDGSGTTLMYVENIHKSYDSSTPSGAPAFAWLFGNEQQIGFVWVDPKGGKTSPQPGNTINDQEALNRDTAGTATYPATMPRYARPSGPHGSGMNVAFCDGHGMFLRDDIDYVVYQQLMTPYGRKCVDPVDWNMETNTNQSIDKFRNAPPLAEKDFQ